MMRSLFSAVSGLKSHQTRMDVIGNNIANVNTVAYKSQSMTFSEVFYQTTQTASGPSENKGGTNPKQVGLGSSVGSIATAVSTEGASERTDNPYDLQISGSSFFIVSSAGTTYFTRAGNFKVDEEGALVTSDGANVMGWQTDADGNVVKDLVSKLYVTSSKFTYTAPARTTALTLSGNVNASSTDSITTTMNFYDSIGNSYQATVTLDYQDTGSDTVKTYNINPVSISQNGSVSNLSFDVNGSISFNAITGAALDTNSDITITLNNNGSGQTEVNLDTVGAENTSEIKLDATGLTMYSDKTSIKSSMGIVNDEGNKAGAGKATGTMTSVGIDASGCIVASYSNGDTVTIGQIAVASFANPEGLEKAGENLWSATLNSGLFDGIGQEVTTGDGKITSGVLEMSNVDLSGEFTSMITTQRGFQANSRIITVSDTLLEELINLKR
ncbi:flagellar hook protein FlgE [Lachnospira multipara]|uniref:flagellar hook protein FlgE n=1 Tax=Lachnospira multipara TaxID=28051 RepID=UPI0004895074|nr:flagellar hook protein FlgE [Lachnospira multipara]